MKRLLILLLVNLTALNLFAQNDIAAEVVITDALKERNEVPFTAPVLTWDDFRGAPERNAEWTAMTYSGIKLRYEYKYKDDQHSVKIMLYPYMDKSRSWYVKAGFNDHTLAHEQRHFDITILVARQLAEKLQSINLSPKKFSKQISAVHDEYLEKLRQMQNRYDEETKHGINKTKQRMWDRKITAELQKYN